MGPFGVRLQSEHSTGSPSGKWPCRSVTGCLAASSVLRARPGAPRALGSSAVSWDCPGTGEETAVPRAGHHTEKFYLRWERKVGFVLLPTTIQKESEKCPDFKGFSVLQACSWAWKCPWLCAAASDVSSILL